MVRDSSGWGPASQRHRGEASVPFHRSFTGYVGRIARGVANEELGPPGWGAFSSPELSYYASSLSIAAGLSARDRNVTVAMVPTMMMAVAPPTSKISSAWSPGPFSV